MSIVHLRNACFQQFAALGADVEESLLNIKMPYRDASCYSIKSHVSVGRNDLFSISRLEYIDIDYAERMLFI